MRVSSVAGKFEQIKTRQHSLYVPNLKNMLYNRWGSMDKVRISQNEAIETKFRHLVVNTSQTPYDRSITNNRTPISLVKTGYRLLGHLPGTLPPQSMMRCPRKYMLGHALKVLRPSSSGSTLSQKPVHVIGRGPSTGTSNVQCNPLTRLFI
ncbi:hypothetical protein M9H77_18277 [Catharanthus roseus]|uniref:Uncharacterized protein n=1 Tax=Catharanthus roseus TaxID=4058 RepID=A0ACC0B721_CATRO|nr:hypothetical protein M9H77_18277 [Catharanthus roseus]